MGDETVPMSRLLDEVAIQKGGCRPALWEKVIARGDEAAEHLLGKMEDTDGDDIPRIARVLFKLMYDGRFERDGTELYFRRMTKPGYVVPYELAVRIHSRVKAEVGKWRSTLEPAGLGDSTAAELELQADQCLEKAGRIMWEDIAFGLFEEARGKGIKSEEGAKALITQKVGEGKSGEMARRSCQLDTLARLVSTYVTGMEGRYSRVAQAVAALNKIKIAGECCKVFGLGSGNTNREKLEEVRSDLGIEECDSKAAGTPANADGDRGTNTNPGRKVDDSPAARIIAQLASRGLSGIECHTLANMGMDAADALLGKFAEPTAGNKLRMAKVMVGIAGENPAEAKSIEMMELVGEWLGGKKPRGKDRQAKQKSVAEFAALREEYLEVARKMGLDEKKAMPGPKGKKSRGEKKGKRNLNVN